MKAPSTVAISAFGLIVTITILSSTVVVLAKADVAISSFDSPPRAVWGKLFAVSLEVTNRGDQTAEQTTLQVVLSTDTEADPHDPILLHRNVGPLEAGASRPVTANISLPLSVGWPDGDYYLVVPIGSSTAANPVHVESRDIEERYVPRNYDLVGAQITPAGINPKEWLDETFIRHGRWDVSWGSLEPQRGQWNQAAFDKLAAVLLDVKKHDMTIIPTLSGCPEWAGVGWGPPNNPQEWYNFVGKVVGRFSQKPYYQQHWQIWNEAHVDTGFWKAESIEQYVDTIHNPAAQAIHEHFVDLNENGKQDPGERCIVVYGGWPCNHWQGGQYARVLDYNGCGENTNILDAHYMTLNVGGLEWFELDHSGQVYQKWVEKGPAFGCWQTENGHGFAQDPYWLPQLYTHDLHWALNHNWHRPDQYREYFFHYYAAQPNMGFKWSEVKYPNYYSMRTFMLTTWGDLYLPGERRKIEVREGMAYSPLLCGGKLVFLLKDYEVGHSVTVRINLKPGEVVKNVAKIGVVWGVETPLRFRVRRGQLIFRVPTSPAEPHPNMCYAQVSCQESMSPW